MARRRRPGATVVGLAVVTPAAVGVGGAAGELYLQFGSWTAWLIGLCAGLPLALGTGWAAGRARWPRGPSPPPCASVWLAPRPPRAHPARRESPLACRATPGGPASYLVDPSWLGGSEPPR
ncbi:MAG TPA: hypothetical protein VFW96_19825 [Thermomicrobiales bacterium]|nr:hypothetical protein [Thermomicrobiales bacterium]